MRRRKSRTLQAPIRTPPLKCCSDVIGLHRQELSLEEPQYGWLAAFREERSRLKRCLADVSVEIEHVGSTSVPGLLAKPIIDIAVCVSSESELQSAIDALRNFGYIYRGDGKSKGGHLFVREICADVRTHHIHMVVAGDTQWDRYLRFRDELRANRKLRDDYATLKAKIAQTVDVDRRSYTKSKSDFIERFFRANT